MDSRIFAITISPPPRATISPKYAYDNDYHILVRWLNAFSGHWLLYPEFSKDSRLHYHGVVRVDDKIKLHKTRYKINRTVGFVKLDKLRTFNDHLRWIIYCQKEYAQTSKILTVFHRIKLKTRIRKRVLNRQRNIMDCFNQSIQKPNKLSLPKPKADIVL